jgi:hypothetical protein
VVGAGRAALLHEWDDGDCRASLWEFPSLEQLQMYDSDDLQSARAFLMLPRGATQAHVWLGRDFLARLAPGRFVNDTKVGRSWAELVQVRTRGVDALHQWGVKAG